MACDVEAIGLGGSTGVSRVMPPAVDNVESFLPAWAVASWGRSSSD